MALGRLMRTICQAQFHWFRVGHPIPHSIHFSVSFSPSDPADARQCATGVSSILSSKRKASGCNVMDPSGGSHWVGRTAWRRPHSPFDKFRKDSRSCACATDRSRNFVHFDRQLRSRADANGPLRVFSSLMTLFYTPKRVGLVWEFRNNVLLNLSFKT